MDRTTGKVSVMVSSLGEDGKVRARSHPLVHLRHMTIYMGVSYGRMTIYGYNAWYNAWYNACHPLVHLAIREGMG